MASPRQLKLCDGVCRWCGGVVVGNHRDRQFCCPEHSALHRGWLAFLVVLSSEVDEVIVEREYSKLERLSGSVTHGAAR